MTNLSDDDVRYVAGLSKFNLSDDDISKFKQELAAILEYVDQLQDIDTDGVEPTAQVTGLVNQMRVDEIKDYGVERADLLENAPEDDGESLKVPKVL